MAGDIALARRTARQLGVLHVDHVVACGVSLRTIYARARAGRYERMYRGVYRDVTVPLTRRAEVLAAIYAVGEGAIASHTTAAALWGLGDLQIVRPFHLTAPDRRRTKVDDVVVHEHAIDRRDRTMLGPVPIAMAPLACIQSGAVLPLDDAEDLMLDGHRTGRARASSVDETLGRLPRNAPGTAAARAFTVNFDPERIARLLSRIEGRGLLTVARLGFPEPAVNRRIYGPDGEVLALVDFLWESVRVVIEWDGLRFHSTRRQKEYDDARQNRLVLDGWIVLRYSWRDLEDPERIRVELERAFAIGTRRAGAGAGPVSPR